MPHDSDEWEWKNESWAVVCERVTVYCLCKMWALWANCANLQSCSTKGRQPMCFAEYIEYYTTKCPMYKRNRAAKKDTLTTTRSLITHPVA